MTPEEQRIAIAEACPAVARVDGAGVAVWRNDACKEFDPLEDLNACHEMEKVLIESDSLWYMGVVLADIVDANTPIAHATAAQRCEAFLKTIGKWKDQP